MKQISLILITSICLMACQTSESNLVVKTEVKGLKKGHLFLQSFKDSVFVNIDSMSVNGQQNIELSGTITEPELLALQLSDNSEEEEFKRIFFFGDPTEVYNVKTELKSFATNAEIKSNSKNQAKFETFNTIMQQFRNQNLDLIKESINAQIDQKAGLEKQDSLQQRYANLIKRKYLYTVNFAMTNNDLEVAPYVMLAEAYDAQVNYLDTVYNNLTPKIKKSRYGLELKELIDQTKKAN